MGESTEPMTQVLEAVGAAEEHAAEQLLPLVYDELRKLAAQKMANEAPGHTLQPTALVHEAWLRLVGAEDRGFENRAHFFAAAAEAMRRILVDSARRKQRVKHGGGQRRIELSQVDVAAASDDETVLAVSDALDKLASRDALGAELIRLRFVAGLSHAGVARPARTHRQAHLGLCPRLAVRGVKNTF